jgi:hypothetical protein
VAEPVDIQVMVAMVVGVQVVMVVATLDMPVIYLRPDPAVLVAVAIVVQAEV